MVSEAIWEGGSKRASCVPVTPGIAQKKYRNKKPVHFQVKMLRCDWTEEECFVILGSK